MRIDRTSISVGIVALAVGGDLALAQPPLPSLAGEVQQWTLTGRGDVDGFVLKDGTEVKIAPNLATQIVAVVKPGDRVTIQGLRAAALPLVQAVSIVDDTRHRAFGGTDPALPVLPAPLGLRGPINGGAAGEYSGSVRMALHGPQGEVNGVLMESGVTWRFPPDQADRLATLVAPHQGLVARGIAFTGPLGTAVEVQQLGANWSQLVAVGPVPRPAGAPPPPPGGPGRAPAPPPPPPGA